MKPVRVKGLAVPYGPSDVYNEVIRPGAFTKFLKQNAGRPLPMLLMHERRALVGMWDTLTDTPEGLLVEGVIYDKRGIELFEQGEFPELSISFSQARDASGTPKFSQKRVEFFRKSGMNIAHLPPGTQVVDVDEVSEAELSEISLVDRGAFAGTHVEAVR